VSDRFRIVSLGIPARFGTPPGTPFDCCKEL
jgi:hypothetical protein